MTKHAITIEINDAKLTSYTDEFLAVCWHVTQHNPVEYGDYMAGELVERIAEMPAVQGRQAPPAAWVAHGAPDPPPGRLVIARPTVSGRRRCSGLHCPGCDSGGGLVALVALAVIGAIVHAIWHTIVEAAEIIALTVLGITGLAAVAEIGYLVLRIRASIARPRAQTGPKAVIVGEVTHGGINPGHPPAIAPPRTSWPLPGQWEQIRHRNDTTEETDHAQTTCRLRRSGHSACCDCVPRHRHCPCCCKQPEDPRDHHHRHHRRRVPDLPRGPLRTPTTGTAAPTAAAGSTCTGRASAGRGSPSLAHSEHGSGTACRSAPGRTRTLTDVPRR